MLDAKTKQAGNPATYIHYLSEAKLKKTLLATTFIGGLAASVTVQAASFGIYDPRSMAMGGVGVTTANSSNASFFNPAALAATKADDNFALTLPTVAVRAAGPENILDDMDKVKTTGDKLSDSLKLFDTAITNVKNATSFNSALVLDAANKSGALSTSIKDFDVALKKINGKDADLGAFAGVILAIPSKGVGFGLYVSGRADVGARFNYDQTDTTTLNGHATTATTIQNTLSTCTTVIACATVNNTIDSTGDATIDNLKSTVSVRGALLQEAGLSFASRFESLGGLDIGITPKYVKVQTFDYVLTAQNSEIDTKKGQKDSSNFNFDLGITKSFGETYKAGLVVKNIIGQEYKTILGNKIETKAQARMGLSHHTSWSTVGLDMDLTTNKGATGGFDKETRFVGLGAEFDAWLLQLRLGYRHDLTGNYDGIPSVGLGINLFGLHVDAAVAKTNKEVAASVQLGLNF